MIFPPQSGLGQLDHVLGSQVCFPADYTYRPGISVPLREHLKRLTHYIISKNKLTPGSLIVDIGSNDGTLLSFFKKRGMTVLGVEPTNMAKIANKDKIKTLQKFFTKAVAQALVKKIEKSIIYV